MASWMLVLSFDRAGLNMYSVAGKLSINYGGTELNYSRMLNLIYILASRVIRVSWTNRYPYTVITS